MKIQRKGGLIKLRPEKYQEYKDYHAKVWPGVLKRLEGIVPEIIDFTLNPFFKLVKESNIRNFTIYYSPTYHLLFSHLEYIGDNFDADQKLIADHPETREWWKIMEDFQVPISWSGPPPSQAKLSKRYPFFTFDLLNSKRRHWRWRILVGEPRRTLSQWP